MIDVSPWKKLLQFQTDLLSEWYTFNKQPFLYEIQEKNLFYVFSLLTVFV